MNDERNDEPFDEYAKWIESEKSAALSEFDRVRFETRVGAALRGRVSHRLYSHSNLARAAVTLVAVLIVIAGVWILAPRRNRIPSIEATTVEAALRGYAGGWASETIAKPPSIHGSHEVQTRAWEILRLIYRSRQSSGPTDLRMLVIATIASAHSSSAPTADPDLFRDVDTNALGRRIEALRRSRGARRLPGSANTSRENNNHRRT